MRLQCHSAKPVPRFFGKDSYHLGVELEIEAPREDVMNKGLELSSSPRYCYAKKDGSLSSYGWELVTHPISKDYWLGKRKYKNCVDSFFELVDGLRKLGYTSHSNGNCGIHVHVSLEAFNGYNGREILRPSLVYTPPPLAKKMHIYWFMRLINSRLYMQLSQRTVDRMACWSRIINVTAKNFHNLENEFGRYTATNLTDSTVEVRVFRGNMREDRIRKCVESVIAAVEFSRTLRLSDYKNGLSKEADLLKRYKEWLSVNHKLFPNMCSYMVETELLTINEDCEVTECV